MKRRIVILLVLIGVGGAGWYLWPMDPMGREIRRIQSRLSDLATTVTFTESGALLERLSYPGRVASFFSEPCQLDIPREEGEARGQYTRAQIEQILAGVRATRRSLRVEFFDINVEMIDLQHASAHLTSRIDSSGEKDYWIQEFRLLLSKEDAQWRIQQIESVRTIE